MNIRFLETALCLASCRNFRLTAERLHITQAAISSRIAVLEEEFGERLFERDTRKVGLTPAGERFVGAAGQVMASYAHLKQVMQKDHGLQGMLRIGAVSSMAHVVLPGLISRIRALYPEVTLDIVSDDTGQSFQEGLRNGSIDFCLTALPAVVVQGIEVQELCTLGMAWFASERIVPRSEQVFTAAELGRFPVITYAQGSVNGERIDAYLKDTGGSGHHHFLTSSSLAASVRMASQGLGLGVLPECMVQAEQAAGSLYRLRVATEFPSTQYCTMVSQLREKGDLSVLRRLSMESADRFTAEADGVTPAQPS